MSGTSPEPNVLRGANSPQSMTPEPGAGPPEPLPSAWAEGLPKKGSPWQVWALRIVVVAAIAVVGLIFRDGMTGAASELRVGDCFDEPAQLNEVRAVQHRPCNEPHDAEVIFVGNHPDGGEYPGEPAFQLFAEETCMPAFETYVGRDYDSDRELGAEYYFPLKELWDANDHEIACYVSRLDGKPLTTSVKGAGS